MATWTTSDIPDQSGKLAIVTGATGGLGLETALGLAGAGAEVILAGRNPTKGRDAEALVRDRQPDAKVRFELARSRQPGSVKAFADRMLAAGASDRHSDQQRRRHGAARARDHGGRVRDAVRDELSGHFALTGRLLPLLNAAKARVVQLSSIAHRSGKIRLDDLNYKPGIQTLSRLFAVKLAMLMFAIELDRRSKAKGWGLTSVAAHPGFARTDLVANGPAVGANALVRARHSHRGWLLWAIRPPPARCRH